MSNRLRSWFTLSVVVISTLMLGSLCLIARIFDRRGIFQGWISRIWSGLILSSAGVKIAVKGRENLLRRSASVVLMNHESALDIPIAFLGLPLQVRLMAKKELYKIPFFGWILSAGGHISIDRENPLQAIANVNKYAKKIFENKLSMLVYPEGTRSEDGNIGKFKKGGFKLAEIYNLPVIPVVLIGARECVAKKKLSVAPGRVKMVIEKPVYIEDFSDINGCMEYVRTTMISIKDKTKKLKDQI